MKNNPKILIHQCPHWTNLPFQATAPNKKVPFPGMQRTMEFGGWKWRHGSTPQITNLYVKSEAKSSTMATAIKSDTYDLYGSFLTQWSVQIKGTNGNFLFLKVSETAIYIYIYVYVRIYIYICLKHCEKTILGQRSKVTNTPPRIFNMIIRKTKTTKPPVAAAMVVFMATWAANIPRHFSLVKVSNQCSVSLQGVMENLTKG